MRCAEIFISGIAWQLGRDIRLLISTDSQHGIPTVSSDLTVSLRANAGDGAYPDVGIGYPGAHPATSRRPKETDGASRELWRIDAFSGLCCSRRNLLGHPLGVVRSQQTGEGDNEPGQFEM